MLMIQGYTRIAHTFPLMLEQPWWFFISDLAGGMQCAAFQAPTTSPPPPPHPPSPPSILCYLPARGGQRPACLWSCDPRWPTVSGPKAREPALPAIHWIYSISTCFTKGSIQFLNVFICFFCIATKAHDEKDFFINVCHAMIPGNLKISLCVYHYPNTFNKWCLMRKFALCYSWMWLLFSLKPRRWMQHEITTGGKPLG